ncbi:MAG: DoxX family membrane protein [Desulfomonile tiedjei]|nr:DoxX family membrane protein [Desulfomonile tiedjei]
MKYLTLTARLIIGGLFIYASVYKILDPLDFAVSIRNYGLLPQEWSNAVALTLPWIEMLAGIFLIIGFQTKPSALLTTGMLAVFLGALVYAFSIGLDIDCGCFSSAAASPGRVSMYHILRDTALFAVSLFILVADSAELGISGLFSYFRGRKDLKTV